MPDIESPVVHHLPAAFLNRPPQDVEVHFYSTGDSTVRNRVNFSHHLLCFLQEGHKEVFSGGGSVAFNPSRFLLLQAGHTLMTERTTVDSRYSSHLLFFSNESLVAFANVHGLKTTSQPAETPSIQTFGKDDYIRNFEQSLRLLGPAFQHDGHLKKAKLHEILSYLLSRHPEPIGRFINQALNGLKHFSFRQLVQSPGFESLSNSDRAFLCGMSESTFKRRFSEVFGTSPQRHFIDKKMKRAANLIKNGKLPSEIYYDLGYENHSSFSSEFKKHFGVPPSDYSLASA